MTGNCGEEIVSAYLQYIKDCEFIQQNLYTPDVQGEIDVVGIDINRRAVYICEVAIHLVTGLQYVKDSQPNNIQKLIDKFSRDIDYANRYFPEYTKHFMLWSPIVRKSRDKAKHNQMVDVQKAVEAINEKYGVTVECIINDKFSMCLAELREFAKKETKDLKSPVLRLMQIEEYLKKHLNGNMKKNFEEVRNEV